MTTYVMVPGELYRLTWVAVAIPTSVTETFQAMAMIRQDTFGLVQFLNFSQATITTRQTQFSLEHTAGPGDNGSLLGVQFGSGNIANGVVGYDNFSLVVVPEPATWACLTGLALAAFAATRQLRLKYFLK
jgi:hypothetical protein